MLPRRWTSVVTLLAVLAAVPGCQPWVESGSQKLPSTRYPQHPPQYIPPSPPFPLPYELATQEARTTRAVAASATPAPAPVKLAVANVRGESALLFTMDPAGKLTFVRKLPHGEADDLDATPGQRWVAVFAENPGSLQFTVPAGAQPTWLLRPNARPTGAATTALSAKP